MWQRQRSCKDLFLHDMVWIELLSQWPPQSGKCRLRFLCTGKRPMSNTKRLSHSFMRQPYIFRLLKLEKLLFISRVFMVVIYLSAYHITEWQFGFCRRRLFPASLVWHDLLEMCASAKIRCAKLVYSVKATTRGPLRCFDTVTITVNYQGNMNCSSDNW